MRIEESHEIATVTPRKMNSVEFRYVSAFVGMCKVLSSIPEKLTYEDILKHREALKAYEKYPFSKDVLGVIDGQIEKAASIIDSRSSVGSGDFTANSMKTFDEVIGNFLKGDFKSVNSRSAEVHDIHSKLTKSRENENDLTFRNPLYQSTHMFNMGQGDRLITNFQSDSLKKIASTDLSTLLYTSMDLPKTKLNDPNYMIYFIQNLKDSPKPFRADTKDVRKMSKVNLGDNAAYEELVKLVSKYLHNNDKDMIPEILRLLPKVGNLYKANEVSKRKIKRVYRGISGTKAIKKTASEDRERKLVATTKDYDVARRFATREGWIMRDKSSEVGGVVLEYSVGYDSIILDTEIFGSVFGETEVLIDASKATVTKTDVVNPRR